MNKPWKVRRGREKGGGGIVTLVGHIYQHNNKTISIIVINMNQLPLISKLYYLTGEETSKATLSLKEYLNPKIQ